MSNDSMETKVAERVGQYKWAAAIFKAMVEELGEDRATQIATRGLRDVHEETARQVAAEYGASLEGLRRWLHNFANDNDFMTVAEEGDDFIKTNITRCASWEALNRLGVPQLCRAYCAGDADFTRAFSPDLNFEISRQLSKGDDHCDHCWSKK